MRRTDPTLIGSIMSDIIGDNETFTRGLLEAKALNAWREVVGVDMAEATQKITLREGRLYVTFSNAVARSDFFLRRVDIKNRLNQVAGANVIKFIVVG